MSTFEPHPPTHEIPRCDHLILPVPDTDFHDYLDEVNELLRFSPEIVMEIEKDLDAHAQKKKQLRLADQKFLEGQTSDLPELEITENSTCIDDLKLETGRPRMPSAMVYLFLMLRGFLGSLSSKPARRFLRESMSLHDFLQRREFELPGWTTILENVNAVSTSTRAFILDRQIESVLGEGLDDFKQLTIDSTAVKANSAWPTDGKILTGLLGRAYSLGQQLDVFGLVNFKKGWLPRWFEEMTRLEFQICLSAGKPKSRRKMKRNYRKLLKRGRKSIDSLELEFKSLNSNLKMETLLPSRRELLTGLLKQIQSDLVDAQRVIVYCEGRVFNDQKLPSTQKVLSNYSGSPTVGLLN